jgi:hypothetical protein
VFKSYIQSLHGKYRLPLGSLPKVPPEVEVRRLQTYPEYLQEKYSQLHVSIPASWSRGSATNLSTQVSHDTVLVRATISYLPGHVV